MKESVWNKSGMKMLIDSGWKEFDKQTNCITTGNVYANTQLSGFIRPYKEIECNGYVKPEGELLNFDLKPFRVFRIPKEIEEYLTNKKRLKSVILYMFFVRTEDGRIEPFCWTITDSTYKLLLYCITSRHGQSYQKRLEAGKEAMRYVTE